jgi:hypothetical protein
MSKERIDKERNRELIKETMLAYFAEHGKMPSSHDLHELTGIHYNTVLKHVKEMKFEPLKSPFRLLTPAVLEALYKRVTTTGDPVAAKLWLQVMEGWKEKSEQDVKHTGNVGLTFNYVAPPKPDDAN